MTLGAGVAAVCVALALPVAAQPLCAVPTAPLAHISWSIGECQERISADVRDGFAYGVVAGLQIAGAIGVTPECDVALARCSASLTPQRIGAALGRQMMQHTGAGSCAALVAAALYAECEAAGFISVWRDR